MAIVTLLIMKFPLKLSKLVIVIKESVLGVKLKVTEFLQSGNCVVAKFIAIGCESIPTRTVVMDEGYGLYERVYT